MKGRVACFDLGNTRAKLAIFDDGIFVEEVVMQDSTLASFQKVVQQYAPTYSILSSVIHHDIAIESYLSAETKFHKIGFESIKPCNGTTIKASKTVGADRWSLLSGAAIQYPEKHCLIIGLGTCITYNFLNRFGQFLGGSISPGLMMRFKAMNDYTALLPIVEPVWNFPLIGYDTETNLLSGVILGMSKEIDGIIDSYRELYADLHVLLTGGNMEFFTPHLKNKVVSDAMLMYKGIYAIGKLNFE